MLPVFYDADRCDAWLYETEIPAQEVSFEQELKSCEDYFTSYSYTEGEMSYLTKLLEKANSVDDLREWQVEALSLA